MKRKKMVLCINTGEVYKNAAEAAAKNHCSRSLMSRCLNGEYKVAHGRIYRWIDGSETADDLIKMRHQILYDYYGVDWQVGVFNDWGDI